MRTPDGLFFAPGLRFKDLNLDDATALADALRDRAQAWFFKPARHVGGSSPFAAGVVVVCFIDAAATLEGTEFAEWIHGALPNSANADPRRLNKTVAESFEEDVRHGLVHHARLNRGAEFSLDSESALEIIQSVLVINPLQLLDVVETRWEKTLARLCSEPDVHRSIRDEIRRVFRVDFEADAAWVVVSDPRTGRPRVIAAN